VLKKYGDFYFNTFEEKEGCGYMDNSPLRKKAVDIWTTLRCTSSCPHTHSSTATIFLNLLKEPKQRGV